MTKKIDTLYQGSHTNGRINRQNLSCQKQDYFSTNSGVDSKTRHFNAVPD